MEVAAKLAAKPLVMVVSFAAAKLSAKVLKDDWASKFQPQLEKIDAGINALRTKELKAAQIHFDLARIRLGHDLMDESARQELENAKREAVKALGVVSKVKEKVEVIELILTVEILLFLNSEMTGTRHFFSTRDQCLYFLQKLKEIPQVSQYLDVELNGAFSRGTFHSERMWLLAEVLRMDVDVHSFFLSYFKQLRSLKFDPSDQRNDGLEMKSEGVHASFQNSMEVMFMKMNDKSTCLKELLTHQLNHSVDLYCLSLLTNHWITAKKLASVLALDVREIAEERIISLILGNLDEFERCNEKRMLEIVSGIYETTGVPLSKEVISILIGSQESGARAFLNGGGRESLRSAELIGDLFGVALPPNSEVVPQLLSFWSNLFLRYDDEADDSLLWCIPPLVTIYGSVDILDGREENAQSDDSLDGFVTSSSFRPGYEAVNVFSTQKNAKWISQELEGHPFHEWLTRRFNSPKRIVAIAMKSTPHVEAAPTEISLDVRNAENEEWRSLMRRKLKWKRNGWKLITVQAARSYEEYRLNFFENSSSNVVSISGIKFYV